MPKPSAIAVGEPRCPARLQSVLVWAIAVGSLRALCRFDRFRNARSRFSLSMQRRRTMSFRPVPKQKDMPLNSLLRRRTMSFRPVPKPFPLCVIRLIWSENHVVSAHGLAFYSGTARKNRLRASTTLRISASYKSPRASIPAPAAVLNHILPFSRPRGRSFPVRGWFVSGLFNVGPRASGAFLSLESRACGGRAPRGDSALEGLGHAAGPLNAHPSRRPWVALAAVCVKPAAAPLGGLTPPPGAHVRQACRSKRACIRQGRIEEKGSGRWRRISTR